MSEAQPASAPPAQRARPLRIVAVGHSHLAAIMKGFRQLRAADSRTAPQATFIQLNSVEFRPPLQGGKLNSGITDAINAAPGDVLISCVAGNAHNVLGLLNHPSPFDFVLPEEPDMPLEERAEILPFGLIERCLRETLEQTAFRIIAALLDTSHLPMAHLESPPPIPSGDYIRSVPDSKFSDQIEEFGVAPAALRYKLWRLHSALAERFCEERGVSYVRVPKEIQDANGMLVESCWGNATHGNEAFGLALLQETLSRVNEMLKT